VITAILSLGLGLLVSLLRRRRSRQQTHRTG
jgi:hypothetical protein